MNNQTIDVSNTTVSDKTVSSNKKITPTTRVLTALAATCLLATALPSSAQTLGRIQENGRIKFGYISDAKPLTFRADSGSADGYGVALCQKVADEIKTQLGISSLQVEWVPVTLNNREQQIQQGNIDLLCTPMTETLARRQTLSFSIPVFPSGVRAVLRTDSANALRQALTGEDINRPVWRGSPAARLLEKKTFSVVENTTSETWLENNIASLQIDATVNLVANYRGGIEALLNKETDVFFGDRALILSALQGDEVGRVEVTPRLLTHEPMSMVLGRGDDDFRLVVDRALSNAFKAEGFAEMYKTWSGDFNEQTKNFFEWQALTP